MKDKEGQILSQFCFLTVCKENDYNKCATVKAVARANGQWPGEMCLNGKLAEFVGFVEASGREDKL